VVVRPVAADSRRCSLQSSCVATEPPFGSAQYLTEIDRAVGQFGDEAFAGCRATR